MHNCLVVELKITVEKKFLTIEYLFVDSKEDKNDSERKIISLKLSLLGKVAFVLKKSVNTVD